MTRLELIYSIINLATRFAYTDDNRLDQDYVGFLVDQMRAVKIKAEYKRTGVINPAWLSQLGIVIPTKVNIADDRSITGCKCDVYKITLPSIINVKDAHSGTDVGVYSLLSECGTKEFYYYPLALFKKLPENNPRLLFNYYWRIGNAFYLTKPAKIRPILLLERPNEAKIINSEIIDTRSLIIGTNYYVIDAQITHNGLGYNPGTTFNAVATNYGGNGHVVLDSPITQETDNDVYPVTADMAREITLEILEKEFMIERSRITDTKNNSADDEQNSDRPN